jgi:hypothetical protein
VHEQLIRVRDREAADIDLCVQALTAVHQTSGYPTNWPADPARWLTPPGIVRAWIAMTDELPIAGHLLLRQLPASAQGEHAVVALHRYALNCQTRERWSRSAYSGQRASTRPPDLG